LVYSFLSTDSDWVLTAARIILGIILFAHGAPKAFGWFGGSGLRNTLSFFTQQMKIPAIFALLAVAAECLGGTGLIFGAFTRGAALGVAIMLVAILAVHRRFGLFLKWFVDRPGHGIEFHLLAIALTIKGGGALFLDHVLSAATATVSSASSHAGSRRPGTNETHHLRV
jgi:putative oxidoreductase